MSTPDYLADIIRSAVQSEMQRLLGGMHSSFMFVTFVESESADANLSKVTLPGSGGEARFVPKLSHVTGLSAGQTLLCVKSSSIPLTIIGRWTGDITVASV